MKFKITKKGLTTTATQGVAMVGGSIASKGAMQILPSSATTPIMRGVFGMLSFLGASSIQGSDTVSNLVKGALLGSGVTQTYESLKGFIAPKVAVSSTENPSKSRQVIAAMFDAPEQGLNGSEEFYVPASAWENTPEMEEEELTFANI